MFSSIISLFSKPAAKKIGTEAKLLEQKVFANVCLSRDLVNHITSFLPSTDAHIYATTCRFNKNSIYANPKTLQRIDFQAALQLIIDGAPVEVDHKKSILLLNQILEANSNIDFLKLRGTIVNKAGDTIVDVTLLQAAWGEEDEELSELILSHFKKLGQARVALEQITTRFPEESKEAKEEAKEDIEKRKKEIWDPIVAAADAKDEKALIKLHASFRDLVKPRVIKQGKHLSHKKIWAEADAAYQPHWLPWHYKQCLLFADYVFGFLQRKTPANYGAAINYGTENLLVQMRLGIKVLPPRARRIDSVDFYRVNDFLRQSFFVACIHGAGSNGAAGTAGCGANIDELSRIKASYLEKLKEQLYAELSSRSTP